MTDAVWQIERRRRQLGLSQSKLACLAGINQRHYGEIAARRTEPRRGTIAKLKLALSRHQKGDLPEIPFMVYRLCLANVCQAARVPVEQVLTQEPSRRATFDPVWKQAAELRGRALYIAHTICGIPQAQLAQAADMTTAAVSLAMNRMEDASDPDEDLLFQAIETALGGL